MSSISSIPKFSCGGAHSMTGSHFILFVWGKEKHVKNVWSPSDPRLCEQAGDKTGRTLVFFYWQGFLRVPQTVSYKTRWIPLLNPLLPLVGVLSSPVLELLTPSLHNRDWCYCCRPAWWALLCRSMVTVFQFCSVSSQITAVYLGYAPPSRFAKVFHFKFPGRCLGLKMIRLTGRWSKIKRLDEAKMGNCPSAQTEGGSLCMDTVHGAAWHWWEVNGNITQMVKHADEILSSRDEVESSVCLSSPLIF